MVRILFAFYSPNKIIYLGCVHGDIRLRDGTTPLEGYVEVCLNNVWTLVCRERWDNTDARVVCRQLQFSTAGSNGYKKFTLIL